MVALAERLRLKLDSSDRKNMVGSQIIPDKGNRKLTHYLGAGGSSCKVGRIRLEHGGYLVTFGLTPGPSTP